MNTIDLKKELKQLYNCSAKKVAVVEVPELSFLRIDGSGNPNTSPEYADAVAALYSLAYTLKFMLKKGLTARDYAVMPLEGLWWADDMDTFVSGRKDQWKWTMMIAQPEEVTGELFAAASAEVERKKPNHALCRVRLERYHEDLAAQILHIGSYAAEAPTIAQLHDFIASNGYTRRGKHHEIYLGDPRRSAPEKLRTIIRQPMAVAEMSAAPVV
jgi:hypothetical protein